MSKSPKPEFFEGDYLKFEMAYVEHCGALSDDRVLAARLVAKDLWESTGRALPPQVTFAEPSSPTNNYECPQCHLDNSLEPRMTNGLVQCANIVCGLRFDPRVTDFARHVVANAGVNPSRWGRTAGVNPKDIIGDTKTPMGLVPKVALAAWSWVMSLGAKKYGPYNWRENPVRESVYITAAMRHLVQAELGEDLDGESEQLHYAHVMACMAILIDAKATGNLVDDRPKSEGALAAYNQMGEQHDGT